MPLSKPIIVSNNNICIDISGSVISEMSIFGTDIASGEIQSHKTDTSGAVTVTDISSTSSCVQETDTEISDTNISTIVSRSEMHVIDTDISATNTHIRDSFETNIIAGTDIPVSDTTGIDISTTVISVNNIHGTDGSSDGTVNGRSCNSGGFDISLYELIISKDDITDLIRTDRELSSWTGIVSYNVLGGITDNLELTLSANFVHFDWDVEKLIILVFIKLKLNLSFATMATLFRKNEHTISKYFFLYCRI